jgi:hypothetical protein
MHGHPRSGAKRRFVDGDEGRATTRVQLEMPPQAMDRLQRLKERTEAASYAEVIRNAIRLYEALVAEAEKGHEFAIKSPDGIIAPYRIFV